MPPDVDKTSYVETFLGITRVWPMYSGKHNYNKSEHNQMKQKQKTKTIGFDTIEINLVFHLCEWVSESLTEWIPEMHTHQGLSKHNFI